MPTFIRVIEIWVPDREGTLLELQGGHFGSTRAFAVISRTMCFGKGEGLPGRAWEQRRPLVLKQFEGSYFRRTRAAVAEGLTCAIALPVYAGERLTAVMLIFCGDDDAHAGAIELWRNDPAESADMTLDDGYYGATADVFEFMSRNMSFRKGSGLPGVVWETGLPVFLPDLGKGGRFLRADSAIKVGINRGFALPCPSPERAAYVMAFLSALATPIVRRFETWVPDADSDSLRRKEGFCERFGALPASIDRGVERWQGALGRAWSTGVPAIAGRAASEPGEVGAGARDAEHMSLVAMPIHRGGEVAAVVAWYL